MMSSFGHALRIGNASVGYFDHARDNCLEQSCRCYPGDSSKRSAIATFSACLALHCGQQFVNWRNNEIETLMNEVFQALSDPTRREILRLLKAGDLTAGEISDQFVLARSTLSGHFNVLKHAGLIVCERNGTSLVYSLHISAVEELMAGVMTLFGSNVQGNET